LGLSLQEKHLSLVEGRLKRLHQKLENMVAPSGYSSIFRFEKPFYGFNCGHVGFLMNSCDTDQFYDSLSQAQPKFINLLKMTAQNDKEDIQSAFAMPPPK